MDPVIQTVAESNSQSFHIGWELNYSEGNRVARYPYTEVVSYVISNFGKDLRSNKPLKALELGFGAGNHIAFLAKEGFETFGILVVKKR
jgi:tRNA G46 methylase TrmB